jgi:hypothetical protein
MANNERKQVVMQNLTAITEIRGGVLEGFENRVLRRIFGPKREEGGSWRKLHNDELHCLYSSPNIVRVIKSRRMWWAGHVARMVEGRDVYRVLKNMRNSGTGALKSRGITLKSNISFLSVHLQ